MKIDEKQITHVSTLARLRLTEDEKTEFSTQLTSIINYVEKIKQLDTDNVVASDHIVEVENVFRADQAGNSIKQSAIQAMAPQFTEGHFVVPKIIEEA